MEKQSVMYRLIVLILLLNGGGYSHAQTLSDTSVAIISLDTNMNWSWHLQGADNYEGSSYEVKGILNLLDSAVMQYNSSSDKKFGLEITSDVRKQLVFGRKGNGDVVCWVNCFCFTPSKPHTQSGNIKNWRKEILVFNDGGSCFYHLIVNLSTNSWSKVYVNGL